MDCSMPGLPVYHQLPEFTQTHVLWVGDAIQPSHPLSSPSPPTLNLSQIVRGFSVVNEVDDFLDFSSFSYDSMHVDNLISDSSAFSKSTLNIWKFLVH